MPYVKIELLEGRTREQKAAVAKAVTEALVTHANSKADAVDIVFVDVRREDWASGGRLLSEPATPAPTAAPG
jgi:4-oxalocrotonate tautomerase